MRFAIWSDFCNIVYMMSPDWRPPALTTTRLVLRPFTAADAAPLFEHARNPNVTRYTLWDAHRSIEETRTFVNEYAMFRYREGMAEPYAVTIPPDPKPIGSCGCFWAAQPNRCMELGYWIAEPYWGKGIMAEACRALVDHTFREYEPERLQARVIAGNGASSRVLEKLGFQFEGKLRSGLFRREKFEDLLIYSVLRGEWIEQTAPGSSS
jgi:ribosomal-protein-alanine N-acetyltransferase